ncbi:MAG: LPS export ABC transporter permease LptF [Hyphomicrobiales bacterium]|nr:LPS export ABC transporter permease LptF [Hyphomicrobiales bacterium]MCP5373864.1 LPS export ABC transporter permease LptF [Hyphomicrobiales bacterium]
MKGFDRYVLRHLVVGLILVTSGLTCVIWLAQSLRFVDMIVNRGLSAGTFIYLTMLMLPSFLPIILPIALFTVVLFTYNRMISDRELVIMRAAGQSQLALARPALAAAVVTVLACYFLNMVLLPASYRGFREMQWNIRYGYSHVLLQEGTFNTVSKGITVYVRNRGANGQLNGILVHDQRNPDRPETWIAERGTLVRSDVGSRVVMFKGSRQDVDPATHRLSILYFDKGSIDLERDTGAGAVRYREPRERTLSELFNIEGAPYVQPHEYGKFLVEGHRRVAAPLSAIGYTLVGLAFLIAGGFSRRSQPRQVFLAVATVVVLQISTLALENAAARDLDMVPLIYLVVVLPILAAGWAALRPPRMRHRNSAEPESGADGPGDAAAAASGV